MVAWIYLLLFFSTQGHSAVDLGIGSSSFTGGRPVPALAVGVDLGNWGALYRSVGVQTSIYSQNAWTFGAYKSIYTDKSGSLGSSVGAGLGGTYILRTFRKSPNDSIETTKEYVLGPHLSLKFDLGPVFLSFDTLLGLSRQIVQHLVLNFQDVSHVTIGISF
jgi:hypothetical protein